MLVERTVSAARLFSESSAPSATSPSLMSFISLMGASSHPRSPRPRGPSGTPAMISTSRGGRLSAAPTRSRPRAPPRRHPTRPTFSEPCPQKHAAPTRPAPLFVPAAPASLPGRRRAGRASSRPGPRAPAPHASTRIVTGPSASISMIMCAPKRPVATSRPRALSAATTASTSGSATGPGAAAFHEGLRPLRTSA